jgi:hypothetical protein
VLAASFQSCARLLGTRRKRFDSLTDAIEATKPDIIIACDDLGVRHLHQLHSSRRARYASEVDIPVLIVRSLGPPRELR